MKKHQLKSHLVLLEELLLESLSCNRQCAPLNQNDNNVRYYFSIS